MKSKYRLIIFDFDGVLVESAAIKTKAYAELFKEYGHDMVEQIAQYVLVQGGLSRFEHFRYIYKEILKKPLSEEEEIQLADRFSQLVERAVIAAPWVPGVIEFLTAYAGDIDYYVASGTPEEELLRIIEARKIAHYFKGIHGAPKTKASIITNILAESNMQAEEVTMIGDTMTDYEGAMSAGIPFIGRVVNTIENYFPPSIVSINDFEDKIALNRALFE